MENEPKLFESMPPREPETTTIKKGEVNERLEVISSKKALGRGGKDCRADDQDMIRMVKAKKPKEASTKKNTPVECLKRKRT